MKETLNTILMFFLALAAIAISRGITRPESLRAEREEIRQALARPLFRLPAASKAGPAGLASIAYLARNQSVPAPELTAKSVFVEMLNGQTTFLARNSVERRPIASITKLITAAVVIDELALEEKIQVSGQAVEAEGDGGGLKLGETLSVETLLNAMLLTSSNDAAVALAEKIGREKFVLLMNEKVRSLGLANTLFADPAGLADEASFSTAVDLAQIVRRLRLDDRYRPIWDILQKPDADFTSDDGSIHSFTNNNPFVVERGGVVGGKTGYTGGAGESMVVVAVSPDGDGEIIYVVLGSTDRFADIRTLINWVASAFIWEKPLSK